MSQIGLKRYRLLFYGNIFDEADPEQARQALATRYRLSPEKLEACFSGRKVALRQDMDEATAYRLQSELEDDGLITHLELTHEVPASADSTPTPKEPDPVQFIQRPQNLILEDSAENRIAEALSDKPPTPANKTVWLMVVAGLITCSVLAWFGAPWFKAYRLIQHGEQALAQADPVKAEVTAFIERTGFWPNSNLDANLPKATHFANDTVSSIRLARQAVIVITFNQTLDEIGGKQLMLIPVQYPDGLEWHCESNIPSRFLPGACSSAP